MNLTNKINLKHSVVIVIDIQNDFCSERGLFKKVGVDVSMVQKTIPRIIKFVKEARKFKLPIVFVKAIYNKRDLTPNIYERYKEVGLDKLCQSNSFGSDFYKIRPMKNDKIFIKNRYDVFTNPKLEKWLKSKKINTLILTGFSSDVCVDSTARSGFMRGFYIVGVKDCLSSLDNKKRDLEFYRKYYNALIIDSKMVLKLLGSDRNAARGGAISQ